MKIIIENPNGQFIGPVTCSSCKCKFKYTRDEIKRCVIDNGWDVEVYHYVPCPNCDTDINL